jgi:hypothetical protein
LGIRRCVSVVRQDEFRFRTAIRGNRFGVAADAKCRAGSSQSPLSAVK